MSAYRRLWDLGYQVGRQAGQYVAQRLWPAVQRVPYTRVRYVSPALGYGYRAARGFIGGYRELYRIGSAVLYLPGQEGRRVRHIMKLLTRIGLGTGTLAYLIGRLPRGKRKYYIDCLVNELPYVWYAKVSATKALWRCYWKAFRLRKTRSSYRKSL